MPNTSPAAATLRDFPDWLSPIVVKELRQGLRQPGFVLLFIFLQIIMAVVVFGSLLGASSLPDEGLRAGETISGFFFVLFGVAALVIQPLRGINALAAEKQGGTLDLLRLTRLNVWRITVGKWLALFSQTTLLLIAILPYLIMRYYLGGMQLFNELLVLFSIYVLAGALTAVTVGLSATPSSLLRILFAVGVGGLIFGLFGEFNLGRGVGRIFTGASGSAFAWGYFGSMAVAIFVGYHVLEMGATHLAPPSENRSTRKRLLGLAMVASIVFLFQWRQEVAVVVGFFLAVLLVIDALTENPDFTASVLRPFRRLGLSGRLLALVFCPGWATGTVFSGLLIALLWYGASVTPWFQREEGAQGFGLLVFASLIQPAILVVIAKRANRSTFLFYLAALLGTSLVSLILIILGYSLDSEQAISKVFFALPPVGLMSIEELDHESFFAPAAGVTLVTWWAILLLTGWPWLRRMGSLAANTPPASQADDA